MIDVKPAVIYSAEDVYNVVEQIPRGKVTTYGMIARLIGRPRNARLVGFTLKNTDPNRRLPCHRVVNSNGRTAPGWKEQAELLKAEGVEIKSNGCVDMRKYLWKPIDEG
jgi:methylated-DNA-protein-cysteine methyltransferase-like protein